MGHLSSPKSRALSTGKYGLLVIWGNNSQKKEKKKKREVIERRFVDSIMFVMLNELERI
jgi:hypothetical protein